MVFLLRRPVTLHFRQIVNHVSSNNYVTKIPVALKPKKQKSSKDTEHNFADAKKVRTIGGVGGDGCISFLQLWANDRAGPDGGDGGNGGHVIFEASTTVNNLNHLKSLMKGNPGNKGRTQDCHGASADHTVIKVPVGTIVKDQYGNVVADLNTENLMFVASRAGNGGKGNHYFISDTNQAPKICEYGAKGEDKTYMLELRSMAHIGFIGLPNAGKSTLLQAISRGRPKIAPYPFTTLRPHVGVVQYSDYEQISVADLPGLIPDSHKNKGLGIQFLKHAERCSILLFVIDASCDEPWQHYDVLKYEIQQYSSKLLERKQLIVANKIDLPNAIENENLMRNMLNIPVIGISAKHGTNISELLDQIRLLYDEEISSKI